MQFLIEIISLKKIIVQKIDLISYKKILKFKNLFKNIKN